ncbi:hypothetical protein FRD82_25640, partial [Mycobacterium tuberculosis]
ALGGSRANATFSGSIHPVVALRRSNRHLEALRLPISSRIDFVTTVTVAAAMVYIASTIDPLGTG